MKPILYTGVAACSIALFSCGENSTEATAEQVKVSLKALESVNLAQQDAAAGKITSLWNSLPESYQSDVERLIHEFAGKVDEEIYNESIQIFSDINGLLKNKKEILIGALKENIPADEAKDLSVILDGYDDITALIDTVLSTNIKDASSLKNLQLGEMTEKVQPKLVTFMKILHKIDSKKNPMIALQSANNKLVSEDADSAVITTTIDGEEKEVKLKRVEDRWIPEKMAAEWDEKMNQSTQALEKVEGIKPTQKQQILAIINQVKVIISELNEANTKEDMQAVMQSQMQNPMFMGIVLGLIGSVK